MNKPTDGPRDELVLVVGATGVLGRPVVKALRERGVAVRALARRADQAKDLAALGALTMTGDLTDSKSLELACQGATRVLAAAHSILGHGRYRSEAVDDIGHRALIAAAQGAGVKRFVYVSGHGARPDHPIDFFATKHRIEQVLLRSGLDAVILRPSAFMEQHVHLFNGKTVLDKGKAMLVGPGDKPRNYVAARDVAQFALRALLEDPPPFRSLDIGGHDNRSNAEVGALYAREAGIAPKAAHVPLAVARAIEALARPLHPGVARVLRIMTTPAEAFDEHFHGAEALERAHGIRLTRLEDFVRERVREHRAAR